MSKNELTLGTYKVRIFKDEDWYLAKIFFPDGDNFPVMTQGRTPEEILEMIADCIMCAEEIKISWWNRMLYKLLKF